VIAGQVTEAFPWNEAPKILIRDRDRAFGSDYTRRIRAMAFVIIRLRLAHHGKMDIAERVIGSIRRECLDHTSVFGEGTFAPSADEVPVILQFHSNPSFTL